MVQTSLYKKAIKWINVTTPTFKTSDQQKDTMNNFQSQVIDQKKIFPVHIINKELMATITESTHLSIKEKRLNLIWEKQSDMKRNFTEEMQMTYKHMKIHLTSAAKMSFQSQTGKKKSLIIQVKMEI